MLLSKPRMRNELGQTYKSCKIEKLTMKSRKKEEFRVSAPRNVRMTNPSFPLFDKEWRSLCELMIPLFFVCVTTINSSIVFHFHFYERSRWFHWKFMRELEITNGIFNGLRLLFKADFVVNELKDFSCFLRKPRASNELSSPWFWKSFSLISPYSALRLHAQHCL